MHSLCTACALLVTCLVISGCTSDQTHQEAQPAERTAPPCTKPAEIPTADGPSVAGAKESAEESASGTGRAAVAPLSLEGLMDEELPAAPKVAIKLMVDNSACYVCHGNYKKEELVVVHGKEGIGCVDCHGNCFDHRNDEDNIVPPEEMYPRAAVDGMCGACHEEHDVPAAEVVRCWQERCREKGDRAAVVCTDCHFDHRLTMRTVRWNKETGELLVREQPAGAKRG